MTDTKAAAIPVFDEAQTARLLPYDRLVTTLEATMIEYADGRIASPERMVVPLAEGAVMLSMPASARDLAMHKLVNVCPRNRALGLPTIHGQVTAYDASTGVPQFMLDGPTVTGRRTAAVTMLGIRSLFGPAPGEVLVIGTGKQAIHHIEALASLFPAARILIAGSQPARAEAFCAAHGALSAYLTPLAGDIPDSVDVVITTTTSKTPVYTLAARRGRLVIGVGAFTSDAAEIAASTVLGSAVYVDDPAGARHEAGDLIQAGIDWDVVQPLAKVLRDDGTRGARPLLLKTVGCAAWDLAACRVARDVLSEH
ncbi:MULTISPECIES: bifunctional Delta(1)-pyrroline-2-carboxylate/Delta(1)-piperideine-2-carboxylate reductase [unclassified Caballeronia]|uniref:bifunctional Delta(1)-pyrroline-2-carboxylate/Delta(1)-piperideine-2- carboxylate reductase n=1 Tax=unclassified Caballeronia TaxID=2646786 RepID=UPI00285E07BC|nr:MULTISPECIES: bifunctional Delta(1)-pyrroline-2-carboxylate/Delta(1)-piperideine-2-carboxylate reductase [unclassified Caballeronia]MDR5754097.1 delta(1)-pyrroline-2-carboxylate reductase family protein [Caballeronia sp. LZ024]MDR5840475.1 delta(1)-pyrroline-2-carboxylate reductase family protein [Caballeronia sp. LZ031]